MTGVQRSGIASGAWQSELSAEEHTRLSGILERLSMDPFLQQVAQRSVELMGIEAGHDVLDVGCGTGVLLPVLADLVADGGTVTGVDYSPALIEDARERIASSPHADVIRLVEGDATSLPFEDAAFDSAHVERVLMHLDDPDAAIREMRRVVRPGGWVVAAEPDSLGVRLDHPADPEGFAILSAHDVTAFRNPGIGVELNRRFAQAGLVDRRIVPMIDVDLTYDPIAAEGDRTAAAELVAAGILSAERAEAIIGYLEAAAVRGEYTWLGTMVITAGRVS